jgi:O-antigen/teichoic acid export membrane protein
MSLSIDEARVRRKMLYYRAVWSGAGARAANILTQVLTLYLTAHYLGGERYGIWATISTIGVWLTMANFGLGNGLTTRLSECLGKGDAASASRAISSTIAMVCVISLLFLSVLIIPAALIPWAKLLGVHDPLAAHEVKPTVILVLLVVLSLLPLSISGAVLAGHQRSDLANLVSIVTSVLGLGMIYVATRLHVGMPGLAACLLAPAVLADGIQFYVARRMGYVRLSRNDLHLSEAWSMLKLGAKFLTLQVLAMFVFQSGALIIAIRFGSADVTPYAVTYRMVMVLNSVMMVLLAPLLPAYGEAFARGDLDWARRIFAKTLLILIGVWIPAALCLSIVGKRIIYTWAGSAAVPSTILLASMLLFALALGLGQVVSNFLNGLGRLESQLVGASIMALVHVPLALWLVRRFGIAGVAISQTALQLAIAVPLAYWQAFWLLQKEPRPGVAQQALGDRGFP